MPVKQDGLSPIPPQPTYPGLAIPVGSAGTGPEYAEMLSSLNILGGVGGKDSPAFTPALIPQQQQLSFSKSTPSQQTQPTFSYSDLNISIQSGILFKSDSLI